MALGERPVVLDNLNKVDAVFDALAAPARRQILLVLKARGGSMTSKQVAERFETSWATTSRHLRSLEQAHLVSVEQVGRERHYHLETSHIQNTLGEWVNELTGAKAQ